MKFLEPIIKDIRNGENIDLYITLLIDVVAVLMSLFGILPQVVIAVILATLSLQLSGMLATRKTLGELKDSLHKMESGRGAESFLKDRSTFAPLRDTIATARHISFMGPSLISTMSQWAGYLYFEKLNKQGAIIQVLVLDPESPVVDSAAKCNNEPTEDLRTDISRSLSHVEHMVRDGVQAGSIEARLMTAYPNQSMVLIDPDEPDGRIIVEFIGYHSRLHKRPHIELTRRRDGEWYEYYLQQYRQLWEASKVRLTSHK